MNPYLSIVIPFRNDNYYSANAIERFNFALNTLVNQLSEAKINSEIIIVDWNSPNPEKPLINEIIVDKLYDHVSLYVYEVEKKIHLRFKGYEKKNIVAEVASNVGIRRSRGKYIVFKSGDTLYSKELINFLGEKKLKEKEVYRVDRVDIKTNFPLPFDWEKHLNKNIILRISSPINSLHTNACGDFLLMSRKLWFSIKGIPESELVTHNGADGEALHAAIGSGARQVYLKETMCVFKVQHPNIYSPEIKFIEEIKKIKVFFNKTKQNLFIKFIAVIVKIFLGIFNLPPTLAYGVKCRSYYRYFLIANFRRIFFGGNFIKSNNWGLSDLNLEKKKVFCANWEN